MKLDLKDFKWTRAPKSYSITEDKVEITTQPHTDLWQRTYYHFRNDNAPLLQTETSEQYFSFTVKTDFDSQYNFEQSGVVVYLDSENWIKASVEYGDENFQYLGAVVTNNGYSDWSTNSIPANVKSIWFRLSRREDDFCVESSFDGVNFTQLRICHMFSAKEVISFGIYACSPEESSFKASFSDFNLTECKWLAHTGQQPDEE